MIRGNDYKNCLWEARRDIKDSEEPLKPGMWEKSSDGRADGSGPPDEPKGVTKGDWMSGISVHTC